MDMFMGIVVEFFDVYGVSILYGIITFIAGYVGVAVKRTYQKYIDNETKEKVVKTCVKAVEQLYKDLGGEEKLRIALENASQMLAENGVNITELELRMLIEAAVAEFNDAFKKTNNTDSNKVENEADMDSEGANAMI